MAEKWEVCKLGNDDYPDTKLRYAVIDETEDLISVHYREKDARKMAAVPLMLEALEELMAVIRRSVLTPILTDKAAVQKAVEQANAALDAAKGE